MMWKEQAALLVGLGREMSWADERDPEIRDQRRGLTFTRGTLLLIGIKSLSGLNIVAQTRIPAFVS